MDRALRAVISVGKEPVSSLLWSLLRRRGRRGEVGKREGREGVAERERGREWAWGGRNGGR